MKIFLVSEFTLPAFFLIGTLYVLDFSNGESLRDVYANECNGTSSGLDHKRDTPLNRYRSYEEKYRNCTRVRGNLEIVFVRLTDDQYDFSFLENIREVDGYVLIFGNLVPKIRLTKLRVIRGYTLYENGNDELGLFVAHNSFSKDNSVGLQELQLPSLVEILRGSVMFESNSRLRYGENTVNWDHILLGGEQGNSVRSNVSGCEKIKCSSGRTCHENCPIIDGQGFCWGPKANMCQLIRNCGGNETRCTMDIRRCHHQCVAGCNKENSSTECLSCRKFARGSECISNCSAQVRNVTPDDKYSQGSKCVKNCDAGFILQDNICVRSCKAGYRVKDKICTPCEGERQETCPGTGDHWITKEHLPCFTGCRKVEGNLKIYNESFTKSPSISVEDLKRLSEIREITGQLIIQAWHQNFTSLSFLRNLTTINGTGVPGDESALEIIGTSLTSLGLRSLRQVEKHIVIIENKDLCYTESINWAKISSSCAFVIQRNKDSLICAERFFCSSACLTSDGCMGPGDSDCVTCAQFRLMDGSCSVNCSAENGFFTAKGNGGEEECRPCQSSCNGSCIRESVCGKCHSECNGCHDILPTQCNSCRNYRQNTDANGFECVRNCSKGFYEAESKQCFPCHLHCSVCHGPKSSECSECKFVRIYRELSPESTGKDDFNDTKYPDKNWYCDKTCPEGQSKYKEENGTESVCRASVPPVAFMWLSTVIPISVVFFLVVFVGLVLLIVIVRKQNLRQQREKILAIDQIPMKISSGAKPDMALLRLIKESELRRGNIIGSGAFGTVYKGIWIPDKENVKIPVAIKVLNQEKSNTNLNVELLDEARIMASVCHPNCVRILAVCMTAQMMLITQLMPLGCLLDYVRKERSNIGSRALLLWSVQIAKGMEYLEELGIVHRDLAARNVLVHNANQVKITDFGLAKLLDYQEEEIRSEGGKMPIKWLALECIKHRIFTHKSDVWSYGVTLWEMFTYGQKPYDNLHPQQIPQALEKGERLLQPAVCSIDVYMTLIKCWMLDVESRPTFSDLVREFTRMAEDPGRFLVIQGDELLRLPSQTPDAKDLIALMSQPFDDLDLMIVSGEDYFRPQGLKFEHINDNYPANKSYSSPLASIKENVVYENSELIGTTEGTESCIANPCQDDGNKDDDKPSENNPMCLADRDGYLTPQMQPIQPRYLDLMRHSIFDKSESDKNIEKENLAVMSGISKDNLTYYDNENAHLVDDSTRPIN